MTRRCIDIVVALAVLAAFLPLLIVVALAIRVVMGPPVIFRHLRIGREGKSFWLLKFRTMAQEKGGPVITADGDPRITPLGEFLRRWKVDELPQFWNILRGEMSVIGPRPEAERLLQYYTPEQRGLLGRRHGLASLAHLVYPH